MARGHPVGGRGLNHGGGSAAAGAILASGIAWGGWVQPQRGGESGQAGVGAATAIGPDQLNLNVRFEGL
jgi:hypothetical protein